VRGSRRTVRAVPRIVGLVATCALVVVTACGKTAGSKCKLGESFCSTKTEALACHDGKLVPVGCHGPLGCNRMGDHATCDDSVAELGDACMGTGEQEYACSGDRKRALVCKQGKFAAYLDCRGPAGCAPLGQQVSCDNSVAEKGDVCMVTGGSACSVDKKEMLICRDGHFAPYRYCRGQFGCYTRADAPACDETLSLEGDPCGLPGYVVCSVDKQSELICQGGAFVKSRACKKTGCTVVARGVDCQ